MLANVCTSVHKKMLKAVKWNTGIQFLGVLLSNPNNTRNDWFYWYVWILSNHDTISWRNVGFNKNKNVTIEVRIFEILTKTKNNK